jgi:hypothetical protein
VDLRNAKRDTLNELVTIQEVLEGLPQSISAAVVQRFPKPNSKHALKPSVNAVQRSQSNSQSEKRRSRYDTADLSQIPCRCHRPEDPRGRTALFNFGPLAAYSQSNRGGGSCPYHKTSGSTYTLRTTIPWLSGYRYDLFAGFSAMAGDYRLFQMIRTFRVIRADDSPAYNLILNTSKKLFPVSSNGVFHPFRMSRLVHRLTSSLESSLRATLQERASFATDQVESESTLLHVRSDYRHKTLLSWK